MSTVITARAKVSSARKPSPLALWHLLSLDAPTVAAIWTLFFAKTFGVPVDASASLALALAVWMLYAADRINDAAHGGDELKKRHYFHLRHRDAFFAVLVCGVPVLSLLTMHLPLGLRTGWLLLVVPLLVYVLTVHVFHVPRVPKEPIVGLFFGLATAMPVLTHGNVAWKSLLPSTLLFSAVCYLNGIAISRWERAPQNSTDAFTALLGRHLNAAAATLALAGSLLLWQREGRAIAVAALLGVGLLVLLDQARTRLDCVLLRALADAALLTPLAVWPLLWMFTVR